MWLQMHGLPNCAGAWAASGRDRLAWQVAIFMGSQSATAYIVMGWLAPILRERGLDSAEAGYVVAAAILTQLVTSLLTPSIAARCRDQRAFAVSLALLVLGSLLALIFAPLGGRWVWAMLLGCGLGSAFALALELISDAQRQRQGDCAALGHGAGLGLHLRGIWPAAGGPARRGWTGGYASAATLLVLLAAVMAWSGWGAGRNLLVQPHPHQSVPMA